jgi:hypothetical protein
MYVKLGPILTTFEKSENGNICINYTLDNKKKKRSKFYSINGTVLFELEA